MYYVVWKRGLERVVENKAFLTRALAEAYARVEQSAGWQFGIIQLGKKLKAGV